MSHSSQAYYHQAKFLKSAAELIHLPEDTGYEIAFAGRSNAGKSTAFNVITQSKGLAKTSKTPGRTQLINLFQLDEERRLVDLPGYGYAKVSHTIRDRWQKTLQQYLEKRACLRGLIMLMDIRHPMMPLDTAMLHWAYTRSLPVHILLTKADKLGNNASLTTLREVQGYFKREGLESSISVQRFSAVSKMGLDEVHGVLDNWLECRNE